MRGWGATFSVGMMKLTRGRFPNRTAWAIVADGTANSNQLYADSSAFCRRMAIKPDGEKRTERRKPAQPASFTANTAGDLPRNNSASRSPIASTAKRRRNFDPAARQRPCARACSRLANAMVMASRLIIAAATGEGVPQNDWRFFFFFFFFVFRSVPCLLWINLT